MARHNELRDGVADLSRKASSPSHMRNNPVIFTGCAVTSPNAKPTGTRGSTDQDDALPPEATEKKGDILIRDLW